MVTMNNFFNTFISSFKFTKFNWLSLLYESIGFGIIITFLNFYYKFVQARTYALTGGQSIEQVKLALISATPEVANAFKFNAQVLTIVFVVGLMVLLFLCPYLISYIEVAVWNTLINKIHHWNKPYWRWWGLTTLLLIFGIITWLIFLLVGFLTNPLAALAGENGYVIITNIVTGIFMYAFILFTFLTYYSFTQKQKVWESIGHAFSILKSKFSSISIMFLFILLTGVILSTILYYLQQKMYWSPALSLGINLIIFILFYTWMRFYLLKTIHHS